MYKRHRYQFNGIIGGFVATAVVFILLNTNTSWHIYWNWLIACSLTTFVLFGLDKGMAKAGTMRIPESVLLFFSLLGGFFGQILGMAAFRHKTNVKKHPVFLLILIVSLLLHGALLYFLIIR